MSMRVELAIELFCHLDQHSRLKAFQDALNRKTMIDGFAALGGAKPAPDPKPAAYGFLG